MKLRVLLRNEDFKNGLLKVKCVSSVLEVYQMSHETSVDIYERNFKHGENTQEEPDSDLKSGQTNRRKKKNRNKQDKSKNTPTSGIIPENMSQGKFYKSFIVHVVVIIIIIFKSGAFLCGNEN
jgi:hypothetical protein